MAKPKHPTEELLVKARCDLIINQPFFGNLALRLIFVRIDDENVVNTAAVDGKHFFYHPPFIDKLSKQELMGLVAHEVLHCVFSHMQRRNGRSPHNWNVACDYTINQHLLDNGFILPAGGLFDKEGLYKDWTAEAIYNVLPPEQPPPLWGLVMDAAGGQDTALEVEWEIATRVAAHVAKGAGKLPGGFGALLEEFFAPVVDWRALLWPFVSNLSDTDYSWSRPHRGYISEDIYIPSMRDETLGELVFVIDTSGSVSDDAVKQSWSEILDVAKHQRPSKLVVIQCDAEVQSVEEIDMGAIDQFQVEVKGRGGTRFSPAFKHIAEHYPDAEAIIYLTDMECSDYGEDPEKPVLWLSTSKTWKEPPFGDVTYMAMDQ